MKFYVVFDTTIPSHFEIIKKADKDGFIDLAETKSCPVRIKTVSGLLRVMRPLIQDVKDSYDDGYNNAVLDCMDIVEDM